MFSFFKKAVSALLGRRSDQSVIDKDDVEEQSVLERIQSLNLDEGVLEDSNTDNESHNQNCTELCFPQTFVCCHKTGKITYLCNEYGLVDNVFYFRPKQVLANLNIKQNDVVAYTAFKVRENEAERIFRVYGVKVGDEFFNNNEHLEVEQISALYRTLTGRVTERRKREVYVENADVWCDLDKIKSSYMPLEGDWVEVKAIVAADSNSINFTGDVIEVEELKPLLKKSGFGRVTLWADILKTGAIENSIFFTLASCEVGYLPCLGDEVEYSAIESDQERFRWRALKVTSKFKEITDTDSKTSSVLTDSDIADFSENNIVIKPLSCSFELEVNQSKIVKFKIINSGTESQILRSVAIFSSSVNKANRMPCNAKIKSESVYPYNLYLKENNFGISILYVYFDFINFKIIRKVTINVVENKELVVLLACKLKAVSSAVEPTGILRDYGDVKAVLHGPSVWKRPKFLQTDRPMVFSVPKKLWSIAAKKSLNDLLSHAPYLKEKLTHENYADRFHTLLYLEEITFRLNIKKYNLSGVCLEKYEEYLILEVDGLVEKRPSLMVGDKISVTQPGSDEGTITKNVGTIHYISNKTVFVKFHPSFHNFYDGRECDVEFEPNTVFFSRCHSAINRSGTDNKNHWLFPSAIDEKPVQLDFEICQEGGRPPCVEEVEGPKKKLSWVQENLNERQKLAVKNILLGRGRHLPYIIFGPPGTGKTVTLVETIIQINRLMPESRILVTTPSNSAADLITERLIDLGKYEPGELVRLVAQYRVSGKLVPEKLVPFTTFIGENKFQNHSNQLNDELKVTESSGSKVAGRHRITVGTCVAVGGLHHLGLPKGHFTHVLVDEAGQTLEPEILISTSFHTGPYGQIVLAGDPKQLGPVVCNPFAKTLGLAVSLLERLTSMFPYSKAVDAFSETSGYDPRFITKLTINYRTVPEILKVPNDMFYNSELVPMVSPTEGEEGEIINKFDFRADGRDSPAAMIFHGIIGRNFQESDSPSWFNPHEVFQVVYYVKKVYSLGVPTKDLGIVTPYAKQVQKLKTILTELELPLPYIGSVEEFQGREKLVVIVTTVRSSTEFIQQDVAHALGFVSSPQRLNVALTRARALLILVGNPILLSNDSHWAKVIDYCIKNKSYIGCDIKFFSKYFNILAENPGSDSERYNETLEEDKEMEIEEKLQADAEKENIEEDKVQMEVETEVEKNNENKMDSEMETKKEKEKEMQMQTMTGKEKQKDGQKKTRRKNIKLFSEKEKKKKKDGEGNENEIGGGKKIRCRNRKRKGEREREAL